MGVGVGVGVGRGHVHQLHYSNPGTAQEGTGVVHHIWSWQHAHGHSASPLSLQFVREVPSCQRRPPNNSPEAAGHIGLQYLQHMDDHAHVS